MSEKPQKAEATDYSKTLYLPQTEFPMRAGLPQREPEILKRWNEIDLYGQTIDVAFIGWIRHEQTFESIEALKRHMAADVAQARDALQRAGNAFPLLGDI